MEPPAEAREIWPIVLRRDCGPDDFLFVRNFLQQSPSAWNVVVNNDEFNAWLTAHKDAIHKWSKELRRETT